ncbi:MAG TPA: HDOD domain-containing protein [Steroidobacteraceae bacterium]|nr:HDOD domain-containing protein [Gammaproteobacteria bacterium]HEV2287307.1 HDOD domain-containing protein [Steroidobacteraceae bacterium]
MEGMAALTPQPIDAALESARQRIARLPALPVLDPRLMQVLAERDVDVQYQHLRELLRVDPALAARVLKVANSAFYGSRSITSIDRSLTVLGAVAVAGIAMVARFDANLAPQSPKSAGFRALRRHSLMTAVAAKALAARADSSLWDREAAFVVGLLHDLGWIVHVQLEPGQAPRAEGVETFDPAEHSLLSAALFAHWQLPAQFIEAVRDHHHLGESGPASVGRALLAVAEQCAMHGGDEFGQQLRPQDSQLPLALFRLTVPELRELGQRCAAEADAIDTLVN